MKKIIVGDCAYIYISGLLEVVITKIIEYISRTVLKLDNRRDRVTGAN
jgi:hypothetical protein